jgi:hypothetical protein
MIGALHRAGRTRYAVTSDTSRFPDGPRNRGVASDPRLHQRDGGRADPAPRRPRPYRQRQPGTDGARCPAGAVDEFARRGMVVRRLDRNMDRQQAGAQGVRGAAGPPVGPSPAAGGADSGRRRDAGRDARPPVRGTIRVARTRPPGPRRPARWGNQAPTSLTDPIWATLLTGRSRARTPLTSGAMTRGVRRELGQLRRRAAPDAAIPSLSGLDRCHCRFWHRRRSRLSWAQRGVRHRLGRRLRVSLCPGAVMGGSS